MRNLLLCRLVQVDAFDHRVMLRTTVGSAGPRSPLPHS